MKITDRIQEEARERAGMARTGGVHQEVKRAGGEQAAVLTIDGAWIHLDSRNLAAPPQQFLELLELLPRTDDFQVLRSVVRSAGTPPA